MNELIQLFLLALFGSLIALAGGVLFLFKRSWSSFLERHSVPFAAGVLITVSLVGLMPEAHEVIGENTFLVVLITFFAAYLFEHVFFSIHHHEDRKHEYKGTVPLVIMGDTIHNLIDGVAISASFLIDPSLGFITALSTFLHEVPHEIGDFGILLKAGWKRSNVLLVNLLSSMFTILGAFLLLLFSNNDALIGTLLAVSAGVFLYLGASDFLPHIDHEYEGKLKSVLPLTIGIVIMLITLMLVPHGH